MTDYSVDLENFAGDLLSESKNQAALLQLFQARKGAWLPVRDICPAVPGLLKKYLTIRQHTSSELMATWLGYPQGPADGYVLVVFFLEDNYWSTVAVFNRKSLPKSIKADRKVLLPPAASMHVPAQHVSKKA